MKPRIQWKILVLLKKCLVQLVNFVCNAAVFAVIFLMFLFLYICSISIAMLVISSSHVKLDTCFDINVVFSR